VPFSLLTLAAVNQSSLIGSTDSQNLANPAPGSGLLHFMPALIANESTIRGRLRGIWVPSNTHAGVALGTDYASVTGMPSGSVLTALRHNGGNSASVAADGHVFVESVLEW
jgi:hypothetical protein